MYYIVNSASLILQTDDINEVQLEVDQIVFDGDQVFIPEFGDLDEECTVEIAGDYDINWPN